MRTVFNCSRMTQLKFIALAIIALIYAWYRRGGQEKLIQIRQLKANIDKGHMLLEGKDGYCLEGQLGIGLDRTNLECQMEGSDGTQCASPDKQVTLHVGVQPSSEDVQCYKIEWQTHQSHFKPMDCFDMTRSHWYGGSESYRQKWPIEQQEMPLQQYVSVDYLMDESVYNKHGPILEPYWFNSKGVAIIVDETVPLHVGVNEDEDGRLCLSSRYEGTTTAKYTQMQTLGNIELSYMICQGKNAKDIHQFMASKFLLRPSQLPDVRALKSPIWSTWARYKTHVNQSKVLEYAQEIEKYGFSHSQIEIDDMYTTTYGDFDFNRKKFPDPSKMVKELHAQGFRVTSWVTPFANLDSAAFTEGQEKGYWVQDSKGRTPGLVKWWQGTGAVLDATNSDAAEWYINRLEILRKDVGIDSFKFDSGEVGHLPSYVGTKTNLMNPNAYISYYAHIVNRFGGMAELRAAYKTQDKAFFIRMMDKDSKWGDDNGLQTMIPTALVMSLTGYHYILPDMIGGNGYQVDGNPLHRSSLPPKELFIRWVQLCAYLPSMQFSFTPWQYDQETIEISKKMVKIHEDRVTPIFVKAAEEMIKSGTPIIQPLWWADPEDAVALECDSQFILAGKILVAPVIEDGARTRDIYLPKGSWKDDLRGTTYVGPQWLKKYNVKMEEIPTFTNILQ